MVMFCLVLTDVNCTCFSLYFFFFFLVLFLVVLLKDVFVFRILQTSGRQTGQNKQKKLIVDTVPTTKF